MSWKVTVLLVLGGTALLVGAVEFFTLRNKTPGDHITASFRKMSKTDLGFLITHFVAAVLWTTVGHIWCDW